MTSRFPPRCTARFISTAAGGKGEGGVGEGLSRSLSGKRFRAQSVLGRMRMDECGALTASQEAV